MASILGSVSGPQNGGRFVGKILVTGRKIARGSMVSARTRQKFSMPLLFHGFAAPQALVLDALRTFMATHVLESSRTGVGINVRWTWRTIAGGAAKPWEPSGPRYAKLLSRTCGNNRNLHYFSPDGRNFADKRHPFWGPETDPKMGAKSSGHKQIKLRLNEWPPFWGPFLDPKTGAVLSAKF